VATEIAVFDVDHTITRHSTGRRLIECGRSAGLYGIRDLLRLPRIYLHYRAGTIQMSHLVGTIERLKGHTRDHLEQLARECFDTRVVRDIMPGAMKLIEMHKERGDTVILATSSLDLVIEPIAEMLHVRHVLATKLEFRDGVSTGSLEGLPCFGPVKLRMTEEMIAELGGSLDRTTFYSDSHLDEPLLRAVARPVAVNPDRRLKRIALRNDWEVQEFD
jgi:HAD superfamily hydrolase (TIGR01490 family)